MRGKKSVEGGLNRGPWQPQEDLLLKTYLQVNGVGRWSTLPTKAGLNRCGKSCRLRWINYLRPNLKRGRISPDEEELIIRLHKLLGNRWSLIAARVPGRTDNDVKNFWNLHLRKKSASKDDDPIQLNTPNLKAKETPSSSAAMGTEINSSSSVDQNLESYKNLNVSIGSTSDPAEPKQLEQQPCNLKPLQLHQNNHAIFSTEIIPDSESFWFGCLPWLVSGNDADNFYCNYSTSYFADVQQPNMWL